MSVCLFEHQKISAILKPGVSQSGIYVLVYHALLKFILNGVSIQTASVIVCLYLKRFPTTQEPGAEAEAGNAKYLVTLYSSIFLRAIFFLIFSPLVFDGFLAGFLLSFLFFLCSWGTTIT